MPANLSVMRSLADQEDRAKALLLPGNKSSMTQLRIYRSWRVAVSVHS